MALFEFACAQCGRVAERLQVEAIPPRCCGAPMARVWGGTFKVKDGFCLWWDRADDIHKAQAARGERLRDISRAELRM